MSFSRRGKILRLFLSFSLFVTGVFAYMPNAQAEGGGVLYLSPSSGQKEVGATFSVAIRVNTSGNVINAAEGSIVFDPAKLEVRSLSKSGSFFSLWTTEPKYSNSDGTIEFGGGLPTPGFSGSNGLILTINFRPKAATPTRGTDVVLVSGDILANDGNGTNILSSLGKATFNIRPSANVEEDTSPLPDEASGVPSLIIKSKTHPDSSKWYSNNKPEFNWDLPKDATEIRLVLATKATSVPKVVYSPPISEKKIDHVDDGTWYLNGQFKTPDGPSEIASFRFNVDTKAPNQFTITRLDNDLTNPQPELLFSTTDATSGIDRYEAKIDNGDWFVIDKNLAGKPYKLPPQTPGSKHLVIRAFDLAGNYIDPELTIIVRPIAPPPTIEQAPAEVNANKNFIVAGKAKPGINILLYASPAKDDIYSPTSENDRYKISSVIADSNGSWTARPEGLKAGLYKIYAYAQDNRGALSDPSNVVQTSVISGLWSRFFGYLFDNNWWFILALILYVALITLLVHYISSNMSHHDHGAIAASLPKDYKKILEHLTGLFTDVEKELDLLEKISSHRTLYPEEKHLKHKFSRYYKILKSILPKKRDKIGN